MNLEDPKRTIEGEWDGKPILEVPVTEPVESEGKKENMFELSEGETKALGQGVLSASLLQKIWTNPEVRLAATAAFRTGVNVGLDVFEWVPALGEGSTVLVDSIKFFKLISKHWKSIDPTPEVSGKLAIGLEAAKILSCGVFPAHMVETFLQLKRKDFPQIMRGIKTLKQIIAERNEAVKDPKLQEAAQVFKQ